MKKFENFFFSLILGAFLPLTAGLISLIIWFNFSKNENHALIYLSSGLLSGIIIDIIFLKNWVKNRYNLPDWVIILIYFIYNIFIYGFFMGLPVFNLIMRIIALKDKTTGANIQGMFNLNFEITGTIIWIIILVGGVSLIVLQYFITRFTMLKTFKFYKLNIRQND